MLSKSLNKAVLLIKLDFEAELSACAKLIITSLHFVCVQQNGHALLNLTCLYRQTESQSVNKFRKKENNKKKGKKKRKQYTENNTVAKILNSYTTL